MNAGPNIVGAPNAQNNTTAGGGGGSGSTIETDEVVMKLAKKGDQALLAFEIHGATRLGRTVRVSHEVRIEVLKPVDAAKLTEPMCPQPDVRIATPRFHQGVSPGVDAYPPPSFAQAPHHHRQVTTDVKYPRDSRQ